jgi:hypothetical protein
MNYIVCVNGIGNGKKAKENITTAYSYISKQCRGFQFLTNDDHGGVRFSISSDLSAEDIKNGMEKHLSSDAIVGVFED